LVQSQGVELIMIFIFSVMARRPIKKRTLLPDPIYNSISVHMLVNRVMKEGKKALAYKIVYETLKQLGDAKQQNPVEIFEMALKNVMPEVEVKPKRRAGAVQMVPKVLTSTERGQAMALSWVLDACRKKSSQSMVTRLKSEILDAYDNKGAAIKKKEELHKMAASNAMYAKRPQFILNLLSGQGA